MHRLAIESLREHRLRSLILQFTVIELAPDMPTQDQKDRLFLQQLILGYICHPSSLKQAILAGTRTASSYIKPLRI